MIETTAANNGDTLFKSRGSSFFCSSAPLNVLSVCLLDHYISYYHSASVSAAMPNGVLLTNEKLSRDSSYQKKGKAIKDILLG